MKKPTFYIVAAFVLLSLSPAQIRASTSPVSLFSTITMVVEPDKSALLYARLNEIKAIDKSELSFKEKKELRKETRSIKKQLRINNGGLYISSAAIIIIVILLIILL
ncbi:MAG TPA: hypothetical protein VK168_12590 [Saprospiraceae bacterium]|nr:hypothetical protein [Saprospiraceae bacterium]